MALLRATPISLLLSLVAAAGASSCGDKSFVDANGDGIDDGIVAPNNITIVTPTKPVGYVGGQLLSATTDAPLTNATVTLFGGGLAGTTMTNDRGEFQFGPIAAGASFSLRFMAGGHTEATVPNLTIDDVAGNFPSGNSALYVGPISLIPDTGTFSVEVVSRDGAPVANARVTVETSVRYFDKGQARQTAVASASSDTDGLARVMGLPDFRALPPRHTEVSALIVNVAPVDLDNDGTIDLRGATKMISGEEARSSALPTVVVLELPGNERLQLVASNVEALINPMAAPSVLDAGENIRLVFNKPIDRESVLVDLRDETGATTIPAPFVVGVLGNTLSIDPAQDLEQGKEYNIAIRIGSSAAGTAETFRAAAPFFGKVDPLIATVITGRFRDLSGDAVWGTGNDVLELTVSSPIGRAGASPAFRVKAWFDLDINNSGTVGDGTGELPPAGGAYPAPLLLDAAEPSAQNGAGASGFTRFIQPYNVQLAVPRTQASGGVAFEVRLDPEDNGGQFVTDVAGRLAPVRTMGSALLQ